ncbi:hypothetical protein [Paracoccus shanxieyensis]|uniref:hypothetical protein n=1 Tax=Paracoccus shanxieyensis TaxID=2675752 RepID=UPI0018ACB20B|nr:hypothetical protein [Paracoccus shanxieyensis]
MSGHPQPVEQKTGKSPELFHENLTDKQILSDDPAAAAIRLTKDDPCCGAGTTAGPAGLPDAPTVAIFPREQDGRTADCGFQPHSD